MKKMHAKEWVEFLQDHGLYVRVSHEPWLGKSGGGYFDVSEQMLFTPTLNKETIFHELGHWTGNKRRLNRDMGSGATCSPYNSEANDLEESIAWEFTKLMVKRFGGGNRYYYKIAPRHSMRKSPEAKFFGKQAFEYICNELGL